MKLSILVPLGRNDAKILPKLLARMLSVAWSDVETEILLLHRASSDRTVEMLRALPPGLRVVQDASLLRGELIERGLREISGDYVVVQPADLRYEPEDYRALMQAALQSKAQAVFGVRPERNLSWAERWRCKALAFAAKEFFAMPWTDPGALLLVERALAQEIRLHRDGLNLWSALLSAVVKAKATVASVPTRYYPGGWFAEKASDGMDFFRGDFRTVLVSALRGLSISTLRTHWDGFRKRLSA